MNIIKSAYRYVLYGRQIGKVHTDGSRLYSGSYLSKFGRTKTLVSRKGEVLRTISKKNVRPSSFNIEDVEYIPRTNKGLVKKSIYSTDPQNRFIHMDMFIGKKYAHGWALADENGKNFISSNTHNLKPSPLNPLFKA